MPGQLLHLQAMLLARQPTGSDSFEQVTLFSEAEGLLHGLVRRSRATATPARRRPVARGQTGLDLFDEAEFWLESSNQGRTWFVKEHRLVTRRTGIGRTYETLKAAAAVAALVRVNPVPADSLAPVAALLRQSLAALDQGARPDLVWFKALFCFARDEGLPVKQQWWQQLPAARKEAAAGILNQPIGGQDPAAPAVAQLTRHLEDWLRAETEIRLG